MKDDAVGHERPIRVAFIDQVGQTPGGAERTLATFLKFLPGDITPIVVLFEDGPFADELRALGATVEIVRAPESVKSATRERGALRAAVESVRMIWSVAGGLRRQRPDLVYTNSMKAHVIGSIAAKLTNTPCIIHYHDLFSGRALRLLQLVSRLASRHRIACSTLVATSMAVGKTDVIYGPVEVDSYGALDDRRAARRRMDIDDDLPVVALVGRINRWKGHDRFVRIAARVNAVMPVRFAIVGAPIFRDDDFVPELEELIAGLGLTHRVSFHPWVNDVRTVFAAIDVNANCSTREPFGRTLIEAAAAGVPTVCFADSGASETIADGVNGRTIEPFDEAAFAAAIIEILANHRRLPVISGAARSAADRFDAARIAAEMADVIRSVAAAA
jgi:glycosyltransferase involved in cell wall biosynthesis